VCSENYYDCWFTVNVCAKSAFSRKHVCLHKQVEEGWGGGWDREESYRNIASATEANNIICKVCVETHSWSKSKRQVGKSAHIYTHKQDTKTLNLRRCQIRRTYTLALSTNFVNYERQSSRINSVNQQTLTHFKHTRLSRAAMAIQIQMVLNNANKSESKHSHHHLLVFWKQRELTSPSGSNQRRKRRQSPNTEITLWEITTETTHILSPMHGQAIGYDSNLTGSSSYTFKRT